MLARCAALLRRPRGKRRLPAGIASLPAPNTRRQWGDIGSLTAEERAEVRGGAWRAAAPVRLAEAADAGGGAEVLAFRSDEDAEDFLEGEAALAAAQEAADPLALLDQSQRLLCELAAAADEELDPADAALAGDATDDEQRAWEGLQAHRRFFEHYYAAQGVVPPERAGELAAALLQPSAVLLEVNTERPLTRLAVRHQLERHARRRGAAAVFRPTAHPLRFLLPSPYAPPPAPLPALEEAVPQVEDYSADALGMLLLDDATLPAAAEERAAEVQPSDSKAGVLSTTSADALAAAASPSSQVPLPPPPPLPVFPPGVQELTWLQRQVACDSVVLTDTLSALVALVATRAAAAGSAAAPAQRRPRLVMDWCSRLPTRAAEGEAGDTLAKDVALCLHNAIAGASSEAAAARLAETVVVAFCPRAATSALRHRRHSPNQLSTEDLEGSSSSPTTVIPLAERAPNLLYLSPPSHRQSGGATSSAAAVAAALPTASSCVVLCLPDTSADGRRPRVLLGDVTTALERTGSDAGGDGGVEEAAALPVYSFITRSAAASARFEELRRQLRQSLQLAASVASGGADGAWVLYATRSLNPVENEAVVASVLSELAGDGGGGMRVACVPLRAADAWLAPEEEAAADVAALLAAGSPALTAWSGVEGGAALQDSEACEPDVVSAVAEAGWRGSPFAGDDGSFAILLRVAPTSGDAAAAADTGEEETSNTEKEGEELCLVGFDASGAAVPFDAGRSADTPTAVAAAPTIVCALTPAAAQVAMHISGHPYPAPALRLLHAGTPVGQQRRGRLTLSPAVPATEPLLRALPPLPHVGLSLLALREVVRAGAADTRRLRAAVGSCGDERAADELRQLLGALTAAAQLHTGGGGADNVTAVTVGVCAAELRRGWHPAVAEELSALRLFASLTATGGGGGGDALEASLSLRVGRLDLGPETPAHRRAAEGLRVAVLDALCYVTAVAPASTPRERHHMDSFRLPARRPQPDAEAAEAEEGEETADADADFSVVSPSPRALGGDGRGAPPAESLLSREERRAMERKARRAQRPPRSDPHAGSHSSGAADWAADTGYFSRRRKW